MKKLTPKEEGFAQDIANQTYKYDYEAYKANYNAKNMSINTIYVETCRLIQKPKIAERIDEIRKKIRAKEKITLDEIIVKLSQRVSLDIRDMFNDDNTFKNIKELTQEQAMFLSSFEVDTKYRPQGTGDNKEILGIEVRKVKLESIADYLDKLIRHYGGYAKDKENTGSDLEEVRKIVESAAKLNITGK